MPRTRIPRFGSSLIAAVLVAASVILLLRSSVQKRNGLEGSSTLAAQPTPTADSKFSAEDAVTYLQQKKSLTRAQAIDFLIAARAKGDPSVRRIVDLDEFLAREPARNTPITPPVTAPVSAAPPSSVEMPRD